MTDTDQTTPTCRVDSRDRLGEGPCWSPEDKRLYWFDIQGAALNVLDAETGRHLRHALPFRCSAAAVRVGGGLLVASERGLAHWDPERAALDLVEPITFASGFRTNDGGMDQAGAFWWSTMDDDGGRRPGALLCTSPDGVTRRVVEGLSIANTVAFSADGQRLYLADSALQTIFVHDPTAPEAREAWIRTEGDIAPDGGAVDVEGFLWNAQWGGSRLVRYAPDGRIDRIVPMPVSQPTSCAFGGADLDVLYVTSAWDGLSAEARDAEPQAGGLFSFRPGIAGLPLPFYQGCFPLEPPHG